MLQLIMQKGPLSGRVMDFKPGSRIQIGRVVRGNTFAIKDAGISSKHLTIEFDTGSGRWTVTDLGSSNGTTVNTISLIPSAPYSISDGDVIKIGELTAIEVKVIEEEKRWEDSRPRRNPRRQATVESSKLWVIEENKELGLGSESGEELMGKNGRKGRGRRVRVPKNEVKEKESGAGGEGPENLDGRVTRNRSLKSGEDSEYGEGTGNVVSGKVNVRSTRSSKKEEDSENGEGTGNVINARGSTRRTRNSKKEESLENGKGKGNVVVRKVSLRRTRRGKEEEVENGAEAGEGMGNVGVVEEEKGQTMNLRNTRSSIKEENLVESRSKGGEVVNLDVVEGRRMRKGTRRRKDLPIEMSESVEIRDMGEEEMVENLNAIEGCEGEERNSEGDGADGMKRKEDVIMGCEGADGLASISGVKESVVEVDLEKMTLGEWFDYLEEYLPKQIIHQTEDMILEMRQKAEKFHEFMLQQKAAREKDEASIS